MFGRQCFAARAERVLRRTAEAEQTRALIATRRAFGAAGRARSAVTPASRSRHARPWGACARVHEAAAAVRAVHVVAAGFARVPTSCAARRRVRVRGVEHQAERRLVDATRAAALLPVVAARLTRR